MSLNRCNVQLLLLWAGIQPQGVRRLFCPVQLFSVVRSCSQLTSCSFLPSWKRNVAFMKNRRNNWGKHGWKSMQLYKYLQKWQISWSIFCGHFEKQSRAGWRVALAAEFVCFTLSLCIQRVLWMWPLQGLAKLKDFPHGRSVNVCTSDWNKHLKRANGRGHWL